MRMLQLTSICRRCNVQVSRSHVLPQAVVAADVELMQLREEEAELTRRLGAVSLDDGGDAAAPAETAAAPLAAAANGSGRRRPGGHGAAAASDEGSSDDDEASDDDDEDRCLLLHDL